VERKPLDDRQLDALLERLDALTAEVRGINRKLDTQDGLLRVARELSTLTESMQALAFAALGQQAPNVRRRGSG
jgi:DNA-binding FrmR family transcriptional regulator